MTVYIHPPVQIDATGLATEAKQDVIIGHIDGVESGIATIQSKQDSSKTVLDNILLALAAPVGVERTTANPPYVRAYSTSNITDAAWFEIVAATAGKIRKMHIFDSSGEQVRFAIGAGGAEAEIFRIEPGGPGAVELTIPAGVRLSIRAASGTINTGDLVINFLN